MLTPMARGLRLRILNAPHASEWDRFKDARRCMVRVERSLSPCDGCPPHCCHHDAHLSAFEATRMALILAIPLEDFVESEPYKPADIGLAPYHAIRLDAGPARLRLRRREDRSCSFLFKIGARALRKRSRFVAHHTPHWMEPMTQVPSSQTPRSVVDPISNAAQFCSMRHASCASCH